MEIWRKAAPYEKEYFISAEKNRFEVNRTIIIIVFFIIFSVLFFEQDKIQKIVIEVQTSIELENEKNTIENYDNAYNIENKKNKLTEIYATAKQKALDKIGNKLVINKLLLIGCGIVYTLLFIFCLYYCKYNKPLHSDYAVANDYCKENIRIFRVGPSHYISVRIGDKYVNIRAAVNLCRQIKNNNPIIVAAPYNKPILPNEYIDVDAKKMRVFLESDVTAYEDTYREEKKDTQKKDGEH